MHCYADHNNEDLIHGKKRSGWCNTDENRIEQCFAAHIVHSCQQYWTIFLHPIQAQQHCSILLTSVNNVGSKTLFSPVEQWARRFLPCMYRYVEYCFECNLGKKCTSESVFKDNLNWTSAIWGLWKTHFPNCTTNHIYYYLLV
jgi:hypothetical protein